jgi:CheY-like chemotaxis protein
MSGRVDMLKVLIIEDNPGDAFIIEGLLQDLDMPLDITMAKDGKDALLQLLNKSPNDLPDLVILDLNLPKVNGYEILHMMKASPAMRGVPVVVMTGSLNPEDEIRSRSMGAIEYCIKPATSDELERTMSCLRGHLERVCFSKGMNSNPKGVSGVGDILPSQQLMPRPTVISNGLSDEHIWRWG